MLVPCEELNIINEVKPGKNPPHEINVVIEIPKVVTSNMK